MQSFINPAFFPFTPTRGAPKACFRPSPWLGELRTEGHRINGVRPKTVNEE